MVSLIAHEWISPHGGSENVAEAMGRALPDAEVLTLWNDAPGRLGGHTIHESWLARSPLRRSKAIALPFMSRAWRSIDVSNYDFVLASSHVFAHHVGGLPKADGPMKYVYMHTPARTIWAPEQDTRGANVLVRSLAPSIRRADLKQIGHGTVYAANSHYIQQRIAQFWDEDSTVIHPPVDVTGIRTGRAILTEAEEAAVDALPDGFILGASRFVPYKRLDVVLAAGAKAGRPVVLAGGGPLRNFLKRAAANLRVPVTFVDHPSDALLHELYRRAAVFVFPAVEDFGIMPLEAMAVGTPVVVYAIGGAHESVATVSGGVVLDDLSPAAVAHGIEAAVGMAMHDVPALVEKHFGETRFRRQLLAWLGREEKSA